MHRCSKCGRNTNSHSWCARCHRNHKVYIPTAEEIKAACAKIQEGWSENETDNRCAYSTESDVLIRAREPALGGKRWRS